MVGTWLKGTLAICCGLAFFAGAASAADLPARVYPPILAPRAFGWTGCYVGGYVGGAWNESDGVTFTDVGNGQFRAFSGGIVAGGLEDRHSWSTGSNSSFTGGGTFGCNFQPIGSFVLGIEGEVGFMRLEGSAFDPLLSPTLRAGALRGTPDVSGGAKVGDWYGMITPRLGYAWDRILLYAKGGAAFVPASASVVDACLSTAAGCGNWVISTSSGSHIFTTWTVGGGLEWAFADRWSVKAEYMFIDLGDNKTLTTCGLANTPTGSTVSGGQFCFNSEFRGIQTVKIGLNYLFGPVY